MKLHYLLFSCCFLLSIASFSQQFEGIATYKTHRDLDLKLDSTQVSSEMQQQLEEQLRKQFQKEYTLTFSTTESLYVENPSLDAPQPASAGGLSIVMSGNSDVLYRNTKAQSYVTQTEIMGKPFLVKDKLDIPEWKLEKETKNIGAYTCFKATYDREVTESSFSSDSDTLVETTKLITTTAWYTPQIPVQHGPSDYWGLPGLVLEINDGSQSILCTKIVLNPEKEIVIDPPTKGKEVDQKTFDEIREKKEKEMMETMRDNRSRNDGNTFSIRIGG